MKTIEIDEQIIEQLKTVSYIVQWSSIFVFNLFLLGIVSISISFLLVSYFILHGQKTYRFDNIYFITPVDDNIVEI